MFPEIYPMLNKIIVPSDLELHSRFNSIILVNVVKPCHPLNFVHESIHRNQGGTANTGHTASVSMVPVEVMVLFQALDHHLPLAKDRSFRFLALHKMR